MVPLLDFAEHVVLRHSDRQSKIASVNEVNLFLIYAMLVYIYSSSSSIDASKLS